MYLFPLLIPILTNVALPWWSMLAGLSIFTAPFMLLPIFFLELLVFWIFITKKSKKTITLSHSAVTVFLSNLITALFGTFIILITASIIDEIYYSGIPYYWYEFLGFTILFWLVTLLIEWGIYYMFLKKYNFTKIYLLEISILANSVSYFAISAVLPVWYFLSF